MRIVTLIACAAFLLGMPPLPESKEVPEMAALQISSPAFEHTGVIPSKYTCDGADISPPLKITGVPPSAASLAIIVDDPDAPAGTWVHWLVWNIDPRVTLIGEGKPPQGGKEGLTDFGRNAYGGPCPPSGTHRYFFKVYALDTILKLDKKTTKSVLEKAFEGHVVSQAELMGLYRRK